MSSGPPVREETWPLWVTHPATQHCFAAPDDQGVGFIVLVWCVGHVPQRAAATLVDGLWRTPYTVRRDRWLRVFSSQTCAPESTRPLESAIHEAVQLLGYRERGDGRVFAAGLRLVVVTNEAFTLPDSISALLQGEAATRASVMATRPPELWVLRVSSLIPKQAEAPIPAIPDVVVRGAMTVFPEAAAPDGPRRVADLLRALLPAFSRLDGVQSLVAMLADLDQSSGPLPVLSAVLATDEEARDAEGAAVAQRLRDVAEAERTRLESLRGAVVPEESDLLERVSLPSRPPRSAPRPPPDDVKQVQRHGGSAVLLTSWVLVLGAVLLTWLLAGSGALAPGRIGGVGFVIAFGVLVAVVVLLAAYAIYRAVWGYMDEVSVPPVAPLPEAAPVVTWSPAGDIQQAVITSRTNLARLASSSHGTLLDASVQALNAWCAKIGQGAGHRRAPGPTVDPTPETRHVGGGLLLRCGPYGCIMRRLTPADAEGADG